MQKLIKNLQLIDNDGWLEVASAEEFEQSAQPLVPFKLLDELGSDLLATKDYGILFEVSDDYEALIAAISTQPLVVFEFEKFADGRPFTFARELREYHQYKGDIRASGDFMPDQAAFLYRCGFSSLQCRTEQDAQTALAVKDIVSVNYQADMEQAEPLFRRR
ncbi:DUF934 domain-containing protein [Reinekea thalattae]|uniref:DUF934 domain-containing protein n=1 Tax=Reinekea thalattae TaxID=2593301 RepID=A0A5C8Z9S4_9GAMM|nr:DUF934 domain-containing protein [Reinekea thalattae]TXR53560.1 DUF934 domain-containing protein [Reinekea thalattae]